MSASASRQCSCSWPSGQPWTIQISYAGTAISSFVGEPIALGSTVLADRAGRLVAARFLALPTVRFVAIIAHGAFVGDDRRRQTA